MSLSAEAVPEPAGYLNDCCLFHSCTAGALCDVPQGHEGCVRSLLLTGADRDAKRNLDGATPLHQVRPTVKVSFARKLALLSSYS